MKTINTFSIIEYQAFSKEDLKEIFKEKTEIFYKELEDFAKNNESLLGFKNKNTLKAKNYVGIIQTKSGVLEIFPKCTNLDSYKKEDKSSNYDKEKLKKYYELENISKNDDFYKKDCEINPSILLINMLKTLKNSPFKKSQISSLQIAKMPLFEVFITMFLDEFDSVYKKGLMRSYVSSEENRTFLKGKLLFNEHIKSNLIHKERFFTSSDEFVLDIAPNRLIKSTLNFLKSKTSLNKFKIIKAIQMLDEVEFSTNYEKDFSFKISRHFDYYENILSWCKIFLQNQSFAPYKGKNEAFALLFPMEKLFENYMAYMFKLANPSKNIKTQSSGKYLISKNSENCFMLKPDLYIENEMILDAKWKIPDQNSEDKKHGIAQSDLYQIFAYACKFKINDIKLVYPLCERTNELKNRIKELEFKANYHLYFESEKCGIKVQIFFAPLPF
ncbi:McrBC 5-methylcytosine restriction system, component McrC [Campylobacter subantarcticus]|uniref:McrBC 5-methylcytosine restriction system, component McrC n=1 Tax=Campylobacter subantarcticus LMG 24374 TaxID=1388751 RepID=A0A0A8H7R6_9BACT|nr:McrBC 5-methylcytosine restriction system, component McrC [Campylobacter subantarcticus]AJC90131.1 McrBC 5-methylcytosine restriction system, component McrC [Campylobacter subantarcticus LMG 24374]EAJ1261312.1 McrBC 5-methylcytosine restriction system, component McrC [Campylobacter lari]